MNLFTIKNAPPPTPVDNCISCGASYYFNIASNPIYYEQNCWANYIYIGDDINPADFIIFNFNVIDSSQQNQSECFDKLININKTVKFELIQGNNYAIYNIPFGVISKITTDPSPLPFPPYTYYSVPNINQYLQSYNNNFSEQQIFVKIIYCD
jgi:hypothetical protein